jgi:hypothetical protein
MATTDSEQSWQWPTANTETTRQARLAPLPIVTRRRKHRLDCKPEFRFSDQCGFLVEIPAPIPFDLGADMTKEALAIARNVAFILGL